MTKANKLPKFIQTELGKTYISIVPVLRATREYKCPCCEELIKIAEEHLYLEPEVAAGLKRHAHADCIVFYLTNKIPVRLHPNEKTLEQKVWGEKDEK